MDRLSSGEQEVLGLMYFVRRLSARGGILLIDEPEMHLHPALQRSLFTVLESVAERAQVWIVTHSPKLVAAASLEAILHIEQARPDGANQAKRASDEEGRATLMGELGMNAVDLLQNDLIIVVEGASDAALLQEMLPLELSRALLYEAGNASGVEATCRTLMSAGGPLPWIAIRDRDLLSDEQVAAREAELPGLFIWPGRTIETELLSASVVQSTLANAGQSMDVEEVSVKLRELADRQRPEIHASLTEQRLIESHPLRLRAHSNALDQVRAYNEAAKQATEDKLQAFDTVADEVEEHLKQRWEVEWSVLMDAKRALGQFVSLSPFDGRRSLTSALASTISRSPEVRPPGVQRLVGRIADLVP